MERIKGIINSNDTYIHKLELIDEYLHTIFDLKIDSVIEIIIEYFGEKYRSIIMDRFSKLTILIGMNRDTIKEYSPSFHIETLNNFKDGQSLEFIHKFGLLKDENLNFTKAAFEDEENCCTKFGKYWFIYHDLFSSFNEETIVHELVHALTSEVLLLILNDNETEVVCSLGVETSIPGDNHYERNIDELLTQIVTKRIVLKLHDKDINLIPLEDYVSDYDKRLYMIEEFYNTYKSEIIEAMVTIHKNRLIYTVGKENYNELVSLVNDNWNSRDKGVIDNISRIMSSMNRSKCEETHPRRIKSYLKYKHH